MKKIFIDTREFAHPKPFEMAIKVIKDLDNENYLYMLHTKEPIPLLDLAKEQHCKVVSKQDSQDEWHILISNNQEIDLHSYLSAEAFGV